ncbi:MAG TPA: sigma-70 family RNA polymerase sigma factor [Verrucomicrobiales bacterium]|jgi:RNA polymerase sigma-70 factor (ECF subfamily)|nr:sigma-70 family RNA polymerase sigma factor [Verrucomicrobiales bacterium]
MAPDHPSPQPLTEIPVATLTTSVSGFGLVAETTATRMTDGALTEKEQDRLLVERSREGDTAAFDTLVLKFTPKLYQLVYNMTSNREDTCDLLQDVFARAYRSLKRFRGDSGFHTWVHTIAVNTTINFLKRRNNRYAVSLDDMDSAIQRDKDYLELTATSDPVREAGLNELQKQLNDALQKLPESHRAVVVMFDIQGMPHNEIGRIMGLSAGTVRSRLHYAHRQLQALLSDYLK